MVFTLKCFHQKWRLRLCLPFYTKTMKTHRQNGYLWIRRPKWRPQKRRQRKCAFSLCKPWKMKMALVGQPMVMWFWSAKWRTRLWLFYWSFIANLLAVYQLNIFINLLMELSSYSSERWICMDYVSLLNRLVMRRQRKYRRQPRARRFWIKPGRSQAWWDSFANNVVPPEEWKENFRMSRATFYSLYETLRVRQSEQEIL